MAQALHIISGGLQPREALAINGGNYSEGGLTAAGTTKATALVLPASKNIISICSSGKGVSLPGNTIQGDDIDIYNNGANALLVYTPLNTSQTITNGSANGGFTVSALKGARFTLTSSTLWMVNYSK